MLWRACGADPAGPEARQAVRRVREHVAWEHDGEPFFAGEAEPCINGKVVALGAYFGEHVHGIVDRLLRGQMSDGGWRVAKGQGATRGFLHTPNRATLGVPRGDRGAGAKRPVGAERRRRV